MNRSIFAFILTFCALMPVLALADDWPAWVEVTDPVAAEESGEDFVYGGVHSMLYDVQIRLNPDGFDRFSRRVEKVVARVGLENLGTARFDYDPTQEDLIVHGIWRERDGVRSKLENLEFIDIRREDEIDYGILDGRMTRYAQIYDLRVGDTIDTSWTVVAKPSVFPKHFLYWRTEKPVSGYQIDQLQVLAPQSRSIAINGPAIPKISTTGGWTEYRWRQENAPSVDIGDSTKSWEDFYGETQITTASDWNEIVASIADAYEPQPLPDALIETIDGFKGTQDVRVTAAFRLVQEQIRYMGIEIGAGGYLPRTPKTVWSRRFGDCKDKALLLVSILAHMDIDADVVLVNLYDSKRLADYLPSPYVFNHAIVRVRGDGDPYFLDPTDVLQGGVGSEVRTADFHWALPTTLQSDALVPVPEQAVDNATYEVLSRYEFKDQGDLAAELYVETTYRGEDADWQRYKFNRSGTDERAESFLEWYVERYPGAEVLTPLHIADDLDANVLIVYEHYGLTDAGLEEHRKPFWMNPYATSGELEDLPDGGIDAPYEIYPVFHRHKVELVGIPSLGIPSNFSVENPFFYFKRQGYAVEDGIAAEFEVKTLVAEIQPDEAESYTTAVEAQSMQRDYRYDLGYANRLLEKQLIFGLSVHSAIALLSLSIVAFITLLGCYRGYMAERKARKTSAVGPVAAS